MALRGIKRMCRLEAVSSLYETNPVGPEQPLYYNAACQIETGLEPLPLLRFLKNLEQEIGRRPSPVRLGPRIIDIDILLYAGLVIEREELTIPHRGLAERAFALVPLAEIAPAEQHPLADKTVSQLLKAADMRGVRVIGSVGWDGVLAEAGTLRI